MKQLQNAIRDLEHEITELENVQEDKPLDLTEQEEGVKVCHHFLQTILFTSLFTYLCLLEMR